MGNSKTSYCKFGPSESYLLSLFLSDARREKEVGNKQAKVFTQARNLFSQKRSCPLKPGKKHT